MADYNAIKQQKQQEEDDIYKPLIDAITNAYSASKADKLKAAAEIPQQFQGARESAYLNNQKANAAIPEQMSNLGYSGDSGLAYDARIANNTAWQKSVDTANKGQDTAQNTAQQGINSLDTNYQSNLGTMRSNEAKDVDSAASTAYNTAVAQEEAVKQAQAAAEEKQREYDASVALAKYKADLNQQTALTKAAATSAAKTTGTTKATGSAKTKTTTTSKGPTDSQINSMRSGLIKQYIPNGRVSSNASYQALYKAIDSLSYPTAAKLTLLDTIPALDPVTKKMTTFGQAYKSFVTPNYLSGYTK